MNLNSPDLNATETIDNITVPVPKSKDELRMLYSAFPASQSLSFQKSMGAAVNGYFSMAGLDFCLDLCLDHAEGEVFQVRWVISPCSSMLAPLSKRMVF